MVLLIIASLALIFSFYKLKNLTIVFGLLAFVFGIYCGSFDPFPISIIGGISSICGGLALSKI